MGLVLCRAVCPEEAQRTLERQSLQYGRNREKCFSPYLEWIQSVVMNGDFNNSKHKPDRYSKLLKFEFTEDSIAGFRICRNEWKTNIRQGNKVKLVKVTEVR